jgi:glycosyltransferase involved in cell wall biosynthesis
LSETLSSVESQSYTNYEHIIIDGESTDETKSIVKRYKKDRDYVKDFYYPPKGVNNAMNLGIKRAKGKYLIHLNSDDYLHDKNVLKDVAKFLENNREVDWIYGKIGVVDGKDNKLGEFPNWNIFQKSNNFILKFINYIPHQAVFIKSSVFNKYGLFDEEYNTMPDYEYWLRICKRTKWKFMDRKISFFRVWENTATYNKAIRKEGERVVAQYHKKHSNFIEHLLFIFINDVLINLYRKVKQLG